MTGYKWFKKGDPILISPEKINEILSGLVAFLYGELMAFKKGS